MTQKDTTAPPSPILIAARRCDHDLVKWFLEKDPALIREKDEYNANLLHYIEDEGLFRKIVQDAPELLQSAISSESSEGYPIHHAFSNNFSPTFIQWIIEQDPSQLYLYDHRKGLAIHYAVLKSRTEESMLDLIKWMLSKDPTLINAKDKDGQNLFHWATERLAIEKFLLEHAPEQLLEKDSNGLLPIHYMPLTTNRNCLIVSIFEKFPQLLEEKDRLGYLPIHHACDRRNNELVEWIISRNPTFGQRNCPIYDHSEAPAPIIIAARWESCFLVRWFLEQDPSWIWEERNLLHYVTDEFFFKEIVQKAPGLLLKASSGSEEYPIHSCFLKQFSPTFIRWVIEQDLSQLYLKDSNGELVIHKAISSDKEDAFEVLVKWILSKDPTLINAKTKYGCNLFHFAAYRRYTPAIEFLLDRAPEKFLEKDDEGNLPIYDISWEPKNNPFLISLFEKFPQLLQERNRNGYLPIHRAAEEGNKELIEWIIAHSSSYGKVEDDRCPAPILIAARYGQYDLITWFLEKDPQSIREVWKEGDASATILWFLDNEELFNKVVQKAPELLLKPLSHCGGYPIHICLDRGFSIPFIQWMIEQDLSQLYLEDSEGELAIHRAFNKNNGVILKWILSKDPTLINAKTKNGLTLFHFAALAGNLPMLEFLFEHAPEQFLERDHSGALSIHFLSRTVEETPFLISIFKKFPQLLEERDSEGYLPIHHACEGGNQELVEWIMANTSEK